MVNNQIGFTTNYLDGRSSTYCTDVGKATLSPVLHVNADDVEAVVHAMHFAVAYRNRFKRDVFIDLLGYRKYGHNEGDEPRFTQPKLYKAIANHKNPRDIYAEKLISERVITHHELELMEKEYKARMEENLEVSRKEQNTIITPFMQDEWEGFERVKVDGMLDSINTSCDQNVLEKVGSAITKLPEDKSFIRKIQRLISERHKMFFKTKTLDWAMGEMLALSLIHI